MLAFCRTIEDAGHEAMIYFNKSNTRENFYLEELVEYGGVGFVCGEDYRFGKNGAGNAEKLAEFAKKRGFSCEILPEQQMDGAKISSFFLDPTKCKNGLKALRL